MPKRRPHRRWQRRVVTVFLIAVLLPCLFLAYLGIRSIQQEKRKQQEIVVHNLRTLLSTAIERTEESVRRDLEAVFDTLYAQTSLTDQIDPGALQAYSRTSGLVNQVFVFDGHARLLFPRSFRDSLRREKVLGGVSSVLASEELIRGERLEARGAYQQATDLFSQMLLKSSSTSERLKLLVRVARCQLKSHDVPSARRTYLQVITEDRHRFLGEELPYALVAYEQVAAIEESMRRPDSARGVLMRLYSAMLERFDRFEQAQFEYHLAGVRTQLKRLEGGAGAGSGIQVAALDQTAEIVRLEVAQAGFLGPALVPVVDSLLQSRLTSPGLHYSRTIINGTPGQAWFRIGADAKEKRRIAGVILRPAALTSRCATLLENITISPDLRLVLIGDRNAPLSSDQAGAATPVVEEPFVQLASLMPGDRVAIVAVNSDPVGEIASHTMMLYYGLIAIMIAVIVFGALLLFHDLSREQELSHMKTEFISNLTHEIKTPIAAIRSLAGNVTEGWVTDGKKQLEYFHMIERESVRLGHLAENTLDFSRIESGKKRYRMEVMPARQVLERVVEHFLILTDGQGVILATSFVADLPKIMADGQAIGQAILNLLDNAVKYSPGDKLLDLIARVEGGHLVITVKDHGIGIPRSELANIFGKFYRVESAACPNVPGSGIGLTLVKEIVEAHGGRVEVESEPHHGSAFSIYLPIDREERHAADTAR